MLELFKARPLGDPEVSEPMPLLVVWSYHYLALQPHYCSVTFHKSIFTFQSVVWVYIDALILGCAWRPHSCQSGFPETSAVATTAALTPEGSAGCAAPCKVSQWTCIMIHPTVAGEPREAVPRGWLGGLLSLLSPPKKINNHNKWNSSTFCTSAKNGGWATADLPVVMIWEDLGQAGGWRGLFVWLLQL